MKKVRAWQLCPSFVLAPLMSGHLVPALEISDLPTWKLLASDRAVPPAWAPPCSGHWANTRAMLSALVGLLGGQESLGKPSSLPLLGLCSSFPEWLPDEVMLRADGRSCWRMAVSGLLAWATCPKHKISPFLWLKGKPGQRPQTFIHFSSLRWDYPSPGLSLQPLGSPQNFCSAHTAAAEHMGKPRPEVGRVPHSKPQQESTAAPT